jgi:uncharacterized membrane protein HdeD (DUF308 family)
MKQFFLKAFFRLLHIVSACIVVGNIVADLYWSPRPESSYAALQISAGIILLVSGVVNIILLRPSKIFNHEDKRIWSGLVYTKFALWFFFLHLPELIFEMFGQTFPRVQFNFGLMSVIILFSVVAKVFRDTASRKEDDILKSME